MVVCYERMFCDQLSLWPVICCMTVSEEMIVSRGCFDYKGRKESWMRGSAIQRRHWQPPWSIYELTVPTQSMMWMMWSVKVDHTTRVYVPYTFEQWCGFVYVPQEPDECKCCETGPTVFPIKLKDKFNLTSKNHFPRNKNQQYYPRFDHSIDQTRKQLWFIAEKKKKPTI